MKKILLFLLILLPFIVSAQFRMVGTASWTTLNDSTYQASISFQSDLTGMGYLATQIVDTFRLFTPTEKIYRVDSVWNKTFSSASVRIVEMLGTQGVPVGQVMVFNPDGRNTIPNVPFGSTGGTAQLNAAIDAWNARQISSGGGADTLYTPSGQALVNGDTIPVPIDSFHNWSGNNYVYYSNGDSMLVSGADDNGIPSYIQDADADTKIQVEESPDEDNIRFDLGGMEYFVMDGPRFEIKNSGNSVFIGDLAGLNDDLSNNQNTAVGDSSLSTNTTGFFNTAIGASALRSTTTGGANTGVGMNALRSHTNGFFNTAVGKGALYSNTSGASNVAVGVDALYSNTSGSSSTAIGKDALRSNTGGNNNALGFEALYSNTTGSGNVGIGVAALRSNTTGSSLTAVGNSALYTNTTGRANNAFGNAALIFNTSGAANNAFGTDALRSNTTGNDGTAIGSHALYANTTGSNNTAVGSFALHFNTTGYSNTAIGRAALRNNTTGSRNTVVGDSASWTTTTFTNTTAIGYLAMPTTSNQAVIGNTSVTELKTGTVSWYQGTGSPEGVVTAIVGSYFTRTDGGTGTTLYVKESGSGNTGWAAVSAAAAADGNLRYTDDAFSTLVATGTAKTGDQGVNRKTGAIHYYNGSNWNTKSKLENGNDAITVATDAITPFTFDATLNTRTYFQPSATANDSVGPVSNLSSANPGVIYKVCFENLTGSSDTITGWHNSYILEDGSQPADVILANGDYRCYEFTTEVVNSAYKLVYHGSALGNVAATADISSGTWTPTLTPFAASPTDTIINTYDGRYTRVGNIVTYDVTFDYAFGTNTGAGSFGVGISLPIASDFTNTFNDGGGTMTARSLSGAGGGIPVFYGLEANADTSNDRISAGGGMIYPIITSNNVTDGINAWSYPNNRWRFHVTGSYIIK